MITPQVKDTKVVFGPCRLSYTHVFNKYAPDGDTRNGVAPRVGAWIETRCCCRDRPHGLSLPMWERGLKRVR